MRVRWLDLQVSVAWTTTVKPTWMYLWRPANRVAGRSLSGIFIFRGDENIFMIVKIFTVKAINFSQVEASNMNLEILLSAVKARDKNAFNALYDETINRVYSLAIKITRSDQSAEEVVADVYLQVWRQADQYDSRSGG